MQMIQNNQDQLAITENIRMSFGLESTHILFEAFCHLFCLNKSLLMKYLYKNPTSMFENWQDCEETLEFIEKLICFSFFLNDSLLTSQKQFDNLKLIRSLNELLNSFQSNVFFKIKEQLVKLSENRLDPRAIGVRDNIQNFFVKYTRLIIEKCGECSRGFMEKRKCVDPVTGLKTIVSPSESMKWKNFLNRIVYNYVLWLSEVFDELDLGICSLLVEMLLGFHGSIVMFEKYVDEEKVSVLIIYFV